MPPSQLDVFDKIVEDYERNPEQGLKFLKKKQQKDPNNNTYLVNICLKMNVNNKADLSLYSSFKHTSQSMQGDLKMLLRFWRALKPDPKIH